jgi:2,3-bisphosphoglycerate-dependent phosphoglycerate mutase
MKSAIELILNNLSEGESALVVSHATAICAYLLNYCSIEVTDASRKIRKISRENQTIFDGIFSYASYFEIVYEGNDFVSIHYSDMF